MHASGVDYKHLCTCTKTWHWHVPAHFPHLILLQCAWIHYTQLSAQASPNTTQQHNSGMLVTPTTPAWRKIHLIAKDLLDHLQQHLTWQMACQLHCRSLILWLRKERARTSHSHLIYSKNVYFSPDVHCWLPSLPSWWRSLSATHREFSFTPTSKADLSLQQK